MAKSQRPVYVGESVQGSTAGRGLFAPGSLLQGQLIHAQSNPLLCIPETAQLHQVCEQCLEWVPEDSQEDSIASLLRKKPGASLKACLGCHVVFYCGKACQSKSWKSHHKFECSVYRNLKQQGKVLPAVVRAVIQLLNRHEKGHIDQALWTAFLQLQSHKSELYGIDEKRLEIELMSQGVQAYSGSKLDLTQISNIFCRILVNAHTLTAPAGDPLGICIDPTTAMLNHSCRPNAFIVFDGRQFCLKALDTIAEAEELLISYIDTRDTTSKRQKELGERYFFDCKCKACSGSTISTPEDHIQERSQRRLAAIRSKISKNRLPEKLDQSCLATKESVQGNDQIHAFLDSLLADYVESKEWPLALEVSTYIHDFIEAAPFSQPWHPVRMTLTWKRAMMMLSWPYIDGPGIAKIEDIYSKVLVGLTGEVRDNIDKTHEPGSAFSNMVYYKCDELRKDFSNQQS